MGLLILLVILGFLAGFAIVAWKTQMLAWGKDVPETGRLNQMAHRWHRANMRNRKQLKSDWQKLKSDIKQAATVPDRSPEEVDARRNAARRQRLAAASAESTPAPDYSDADMRLERAYQRLLGKEISLAEYGDMVEREHDAARDRIDDLKADRDEMIPELYEMDMERARDDLEATEWRRRWVKDRQYQQRFARDGFGESGKWARFDYQDRDGKTSKRQIAMWQRRGSYIVGYDRARKEERNFRQDRISNWISG